MYFAQNAVILSNWLQQKQQFYCNVDLYNIFRKLNRYIRLNIYLYRVNICKKKERKKRRKKAILARKLRNTVDSRNLELAYLE